MKKIRNLLLDCRAALRRADANFEQSPLRAQLDDTIIALSSEERATEKAPVPGTRTAQQVAYAWQSVTRDLRNTHPELHAELSARVLQRLDGQVLLDADEEIEALQGRLKEHEALLRDAMTELGALRQSLADAVPTLDGNVPAPEAARLRLRMLVDSATRGGGLPKATPRDTRGGVLTRDELEAVASGGRGLSRDERDWCVGEALVLSGFQRSPTELLADGEQALARFILDTPPPAYG